MMRLRLLRTIVTLALAAGVVAMAAAGEVTVMTSGAFATAHLALAPAFEKATGNRIVTLTTSTGVGADAIPARVARGDAVDVIILPSAALDEMIRAGTVLADSRAELANSAIGMAVKAGAPKPDISTVEALTATLRRARSIAYSASVSGVYLSTELFPKLGIAAEIAPKSARIERERVGAVVARGEAEIGFQQISELLEVKGVDLVGPLPPAVQRVTLVAAGVATTSANPSTAQAYIRYLASAEAADTIRRVGLTPLTGR